jgi:hypothetical protein
MPRCKHDDLRRPIEKERIDRNGKGVDVHLPQGRECRIDLCMVLALTTNLFTRSGNLRR